MICAIVARARTEELALTGDKDSSAPVSSSLLGSFVKVVLSAFFLCAYVYVCMCMCVCFKPVIYVGN